MIHSGDFTNNGTLSQIQDFDSWLGSLPHKHKLVVPGNHDSVMDPEVRKKIKSGEVEVFDKEEVRMWRNLEENDKFLTNAHVLINSSLDIEGLKLFGSPYTDESDIARHLCQVNSQDCDVLVTHSPPLQIADVSSRTHRGSLEECCF